MDILCIVRFIYDVFFIFRIFFHIFFMFRILYIIVFRSDLYPVIYRIFFIFRLPKFFRYGLRGFRGTSLKVFSPLYLFCSSYLDCLVVVR